MSPRKCIIYKIPFPVKYQKILELQEKILTFKTESLNSPDFLLVLEHLPVYTVGKRGKLSNLLIPVDFLSKKGIDIVFITRGGDITYHGPGQVVAYPLFNLKSPYLSIKKFVYLLEEVMIQVARYFGILLQRSELNRGVWYEDKKVGFVGIGIKKGITYHGLALNVNMDISPFSWINPCGLKNIKVVTLSELINQKIDPNKVKDVMIDCFIKIFGLKVIDVKTAWEEVGKSFEEAFLA